MKIFESLCVLEIYGRVGTAQKWIVNAQNWVVTEVDNTFLIC